MSKLVATTEIILAAAESYAGLPNGHLTSAMVLIVFLLHTR